MDKATGVTRPVKGKEKWEELWVGDVIKCRVYITDRAGCYLHVEGEVKWDADYAMFVIHGVYNQDGQQYRNFFPLHKIVNDNIKFLKKVPRYCGNNKEVILELVGTLGKWKKSAYNGATEQTLDKVIDKMIEMNIIPEKEIAEAFNKES